jgi:hypothetical protein
VSWRWRPDRADTLLQIAGLIDHQYRAGVPDLRSDVVTRTKGARQKFIRIL